MKMAQVRRPPVGKSIDGRPSEDVGSAAQNHISSEENRGANRKTGLDEHPCPGLFGRDGKQ